MAVLKARYRDSHVYSYVGDILLAVNPFKQLPLYGEPATAQFLLSSPPSTWPHIYAIARQALKELRATHRSQVCLISGESGAGKTETAKYFLKHLLYIGGGDAKQLEHKILMVSPILEAFGNAKTVGCVALFFSRATKCDSQH